MNCSRERETPDTPHPIREYTTDGWLDRTMAGVPDKDLDETRAKLEMCLPPKDEGTFNFAICDRETKEFIGMGGCHMWKGSWGWPDVGYLMRQEVGGKGLATEFLRGWLAAWDGLEREEVELEVDGRTVDGMVVEEGGLVREQLIAVTAVANNKSQGVLRKGGFEWFVTWLAHDPTKGTGPDMLIELPTYRHFSGGMKGE
jgi:RimJ/RimL family protein N-acetyltransferase